MPQFPPLACREEAPDPAGSESCKCCTAAASVQVLSAAASCKVCFSVHAVAASFPALLPLCCRAWAKFSAYYWWWIWPGIVTYGIIKKMFHDAEEEVRDKYW